MLSLEIHGPTPSLERAGQQRASQAQLNEQAQLPITFKPPLGLQALVTVLGERRKVMAGGSDMVSAATITCAKCGKPANLQCPKCIELKLPREGAAFCTQDCFKTSWSSHKSVHLKAKISSPVNENPAEQNSSSATDGWLYCLRNGQSRAQTLPYFDWTGY
ncbi:hypothetical protein RD792_010352 [Penstemon davidsonii]|uniref:C6H2-type domain-containing protein n=1 Tax=Penstemon davidsonii TaxID=160366 RepID=A0ABR0D1M1_9LAMI|nr:hypothetical protein RD792_010352 [Penstemon davidsonii]